MRVEEGVSFRETEETVRTHIMVEQQKVEVKR